MRRTIADEVRIIKAEILSEIDQPNERHRRLAHCRACEQVMCKHGLVTVHRSGREITQEIIHAMPGDTSPGSQDNQVSPHFAP
jgi:hypothetical protein